MKQFISTIFKTISVLGILLFTNFQSKAGFTPTSGPSGGAFVQCFLKDNNTIWAAIQYDLYKSTDNGGTWTKVPVAADVTDIKCMAKANGYIYIAANNGKVRLFKSNDGGSTWTGIQTGMPEASGYGVFSPTQMVVIKDTVFIGTTTAGVFKTSDGGSQWVSTQQNSGCVNALCAIGDTLVIGGAYGKPRWSKDLGATFTDFTGDLHTIGNLKFNNCTNIAYRNGRLLITSAYNINSLYSDDWGVTFTQSSGGALNPNFIAVAGSKVYLSAVNEGKTYISSDNGSTFKEELINNQSMGSGVVYDDGSLVWIGTQSWSATTGTVYFGIFNSADGRASWQSCNKGLNFLTATQMIHVNSDVFALINNSIYKTNDDGKTWKINDTGKYNHIFTDGTILYASHQNGVRKSSDKGNTWIDISGFSGKVVNALYVEGQLMLAGTMDANNKSDIMISTDGGTNWSNKTITSQLYTGKVIYGFHKHNANVLLAEMNPGFAISTDGGSTWTWKNPLNFGGYFATQGTRLLYQRDNEIYMSDNGGTSFRQFRTGMTGFWPQCGGLFVNNNTAYVYGTDGNKGLYSLNASDTIWKLIGNTDGMSTFPKIPMLAVGSKIYAAPSNASIWILDSTGSSNTVSNIQNNFDVTVYPNPISRGALLNFNISDGQLYQINIYNTEGKLIQEFKNVSNLIQLNTSLYNQGVYIYQLKDNHSLITGKFIIN